MVSNDPLLTALNHFNLYEYSDESQAWTSQDDHAMPLHNGRATLALIALHQDHQSITRKAIYVDVIMVNDHPLVDALDSCTFRFTFLEKNLHTMMADYPFLPSLLVNRVAIPILNRFNYKIHTIYVARARVSTQT